MTGDYDELVDGDMIKSDDDGFVQQEVATRICKLITLNDGAG
jgi:hypothetical protein